MNKSVHGRRQSTKGHTSSNDDETEDYSSYVTGSEELEDDPER